MQHSSNSSHSFFTKVASSRISNHGRLLLPDDPDRWQRCVLSPQLPSPPTAQKKELISRAIQRSIILRAVTQRQNTIVCEILRGRKPGSGRHVLTRSRSPMSYSRVPYTEADTEDRRIKRTSAEMGLRRINCRRRGSSMRRRWISITSRPRIISFGRTMRRGELRTIRLICTGSL
jgi:hypothetical protein